MKKITKVGLFALVIVLVFSTVPMTVSALQPPRVAQVWGIEGYKLLVELVNAPDAEAFDMLYGYMTQHKHLIDGGSLLRNEALGGPTQYVEQFVAAFEVLRFPIRKSGELGWVEFSEFSPENFLQMTINIDRANYRFHLNMTQREYVDGIEITELFPPWADRFFEFQIYQGNHGIFVRIEPRHGPDTPTACVLELFEFKTLEELLVAPSRTVEELLDVPSRWAGPQVNLAISREIVPPHLQSLYTQPITRAEFAELAAELYEAIKGWRIMERATFSDTDNLSVQKAAGIGIIQGVGDGNFNPDGIVTREQAAVMLSRLLEAIIYQPLEFDQSISFYDSREISHWAEDGVYKAVNHNIMTGVGDNRFAPQEPFTREQTIVTMMRLHDLIFRW